MSKKFFCFLIAVATLIQFSLNIKSTVSGPSYDDGNIPFLGYNPPPNSNYWVEGDNDQYIFVRKTIYDDSFEFEHSGLYTNDDKKELIYVLPDFDTESLYISDDCFSVLINNDSYSNLNSTMFTLYENGKIKKEYKYSLLFTFSSEFLFTKDGYIGGASDYPYYDYEFIELGNDIVYIKTINGRKVSINLLTGELTKTPSYFEMFLMSIITYYTLCGLIVLFFSYKKRNLK